ncbi:hypothetical protein K461DRAFT_104331 [Myriangium duriaei CBS 260.36]|uniref:Uncharacterized protein n=1 Tax=Myriangium duriaei CBS 260.36 TaxID=1168546 RepID=A0A9P4MM75_9PEZI|nr:hypothetical protein K461DRAFT_104331 [Myriangium duriaei CBS 260.36]
MNYGSNDPGANRRSIGDGYFVRWAQQYPQYLPRRHLKIPCRSRMTCLQRPLFQQMFRGKGLNCMYLTKPSTICWTILGFLLGLWVASGTLL